MVAGFGMDSQFWTSGQGDWNHRKKSFCLRLIKCNINVYYFKESHFSRGEQYQFFSDKDPY